MKKYLIPALLFLVGIVSAYFVYLQFGRGGVLLSPGSKIPVASPLPYLKLSFDSLSKRSYAAGKIEIGEVIKEEESFTSYKFYYYSGGKKISGQLNLPHLSRTMSVVVMARGYVPKEDYYTGLGTRNAASYYAKNGYITLAPDFLGYGESEMEDTDSIGARLYRPVEIMDLLSSLASLPQADLDKVFLWGHSNGGQIMISVAEILGMQDLSVRNEVSVRGVILWAPVSKPFPFSILAFSDEAEDQGKALRKAVSLFEANYDVYDFSIDRYFDKINLPMILHQGTNDDAVPYYWSDSFVEKVKELEKDIRYFKYPSANHNLTPGWDNVVERDLKFMVETSAKR